MRRPVALVAVTLFLILPAARTSAQTPRQVALVYELSLPSLFDPSGEPQDTADFHVDAFLRRVRALDTEHRDRRFALALNAVACEELEMLATDASRRALATLRNVASDHVVLRTLSFNVRLEHLTSNELKDEVTEGSDALRRCTGVPARDPFVPADLAITDARRAHDLERAGVRSALSAFAVPPGSERPRIVPAITLDEKSPADVAVARPEAPGIVVVVDADRQPFLSEVEDYDAVEVVDVAALDDLDVIGGVIDPSFDLARSYREVIEKAEEAVSRFRSYALVDNPQAPVYASVVARARSTASWGEKGLDEAAASARALVTTLTDAERLISVSKGVVTFTSRRGTVPITIANRATYPVRLRVEVSSPKLDFGEGSARSVTPVLEVEPGGDTVTFEAAARSSGTFPVQVAVRAPDGWVFDRAEVTVRSAAANLSALLLTAGGAGFLVYWFVRRLRRRQRSEA